MARKLLIITYYWPPSGGAGVQRWLKFSKYLPQNGWEPVILTVDPQFASYPAIDPSLEEELDPGIRVFRTRARNWLALAGGSKGNRPPGAGFASGGATTGSVVSRFIRGNLFIPDPRKGWNRHAYNKAVELIIAEGIDAVVTTSPPHSTQLIGLKLKKRFPGLKWIADLRDPWTDIYYYKKFLHTPLARWRDARYERKVLEHCDRLLTVGPSLAGLFESKVPSLRERSEVVYNGYDEADFDGKIAVAEEGFTITYTGTVSDQYPLDGFLEAVSSMDRSMPGSPRLRFVGSVHPHWRQKIEVLLPGRAEFVEYVSHSRSIDYLLSSKLLLLIIPEHPGNSVIITGKLFEYLRSGIPVLCLGPSDGDAARLISQNQAGFVFDYYDSKGIRSALETITVTEAKHKVPTHLSKEYIISQYTQSL